MIMSVTSLKSLDELDQDFRGSPPPQIWRPERARPEADTRSIRASFLRVNAGCTTSVTRRLPSTALNTDMSVLVVLPCRVSVYQDGQTLTIATVKPTDLMKATDLKGVTELATEIEREVFTIMCEAA